MKNLKRNIAIVCGGDSSEHDVSMRSAEGLYSFFDKERYNVYIVDVKGQDWHVAMSDRNITIDKNDFSFLLDGKVVMFDYAYITIHGTPGENGMMQGYTMNYTPVALPAVKGLLCTVQDVVITGVSGDCCIGRIKNPPVGYDPMGMFGEK